MEILLKNLDDTKLVAKIFAKNLKDGGFITLNGAIGAGKTTFTRALLQNFGVKQNVTSPTFVLLNEYYGEDHIPVYHFDLYRLENEGLKTIMGEIIEYIKPNALTLIEWADFGEGELPEYGINVEIKFANIKYGENSRIMKFNATGDLNIKILDKIYEEIKERIE